jgi:hypothetical protein
MCLFDVRKKKKQSCGAVHVGFVDALNGAIEEFEAVKAYSAMRLSSSRTTIYLLKLGDHYEPLRVPG